MPADTRTEIVRFTSTEGAISIHGVIWWPQGEPRGVVQIVHGMAEHIMRYEPFALYLNERGFVVCGHDHIGHGQSVHDKSDLGHIPVRGGREILVGDVGRMRAKLSERVDKHLPYFLFGHSMGSFVVRAYISECGDLLTGAIICGTGHIPPATSAAGNALARIIAKARGKRYVSQALGNLSIGAYAKAIKDRRTDLDWLSHSRENVSRYMADQGCGFPFTAGGNATVTSLTQQVCSKKCFERTPKDLPLLFIAGDGDPVGNMGKGVRIAAQMARNAGCTDVTCTIYEHMRHEILNEEDGQRVMSDVAAWMEERL